MHKPAVIHERTGIPVSTLRTYAIKFGKHLSEHANKKSRIYTDQDQAILQQIRQLLKQGNTAKEVNEILKVGIVTETTDISVFDKLPEFKDALIMLSQKITETENAIADLQQVQKEKEENKTEAEVWVEGHP